MYKSMKRSACGLFSAVFLLAMAHSAFAIPYTSWHAAFVHDPVDGVKDAGDMKTKFDSWKWGPDDAPKKGWDTAVFTADKIIDAYKWLRDRQGEGDNEILVFYFAGHGVQSPDADSKDESPATDTSDEGIDTDIIDAGTGKKLDFYDDDIGEENRNIENGFMVNIFDSCYSGGMVDGAKDINGKKKDGSNKKNETVMMASKEDQYCLRRDKAGGTLGVFTEYLLETVPAGEPSPETFSAWSKAAAKSYRSDFEDKPINFKGPDGKPFFQTFKLTQYADGKKTDRYFEERVRNGLPEPAALTLLGVGLLGILFTIRLNRRTAIPRRP